MQKYLTAIPIKVQCTEGKVFTRVIKKPFANNGQGTEKRVVVAELDGVYVYFAGDTAIVSKEEMYGFD